MHNRPIQPSPYGYQTSPTYDQRPSSPYGEKQASPYDGATSKMSSSYEGASSVPSSSDIGMRAVIRQRRESSATKIDQGSLEKSSIVRSSAPVWSDVVAKDSPCRCAPQVARMSRWARASDRLPRRRSSRSSPWALLSSPRSTACVRARDLPLPSSPVARVVASLPVCQIVLESPNFCHPDEGFLSSGRPYPVASETEWRYESFASSPRACSQPSRDCLWLESGQLRCCACLSLSPIFVALPLKFPLQSNSIGFKKFGSTGSSTSMSASTGAHHFHDKCLSEFFSLKTFE